MKTVSLVALSALALAAPFATQAQDTNQGGTLPRFDDRWYLMPFATWTNADSNRDTEDAAGWGLAVGKPLNRYLNLEARGTYTSDLTSKSDRGGSFAVGDLGVDGLFFFSRGHFQPFLLAGIGGINDRFSCNAARVNVGTCQSGNKWSFMAEAGAGFLVPINDAVSFRVDGRYRYDDNTGSLNDTSSFGDWLVTAGIYIPLGHRAAPAPVTKTYELSADALFAFNKYNLSPTGEGTLNTFASDLGRTNYTDIRVAGHTDPIGSEAFNLALSDRRAGTVRDYLVGKGVPADHITAQGFGKTQLKVTPADCAAAKSREALIACYQPNRRVDVTVEGITEKQ